MASIPVVRPVSAGSVPAVRLMLDEADALDLPISTDVQAALDAKKNITPDLPSGSYIFPISPHAAGAQATLGVGTLRVAPWVVERSTTLAGIGGEITVVGDAGSHLRIVIYAATAAGLPGALVLDAGTILGDSATTQELTISPTLPRGIYFAGGAVQDVTTTQPTVRIAATWTPPIDIRSGTTLPSAGATMCGYSMTGVTGAAPANFSATPTATGTVPRVFVRKA